jgi:hypothetical protein
LLEANDVKEKRKSKAAFSSFFPFTIPMLSLTLTSNSHTCCCCYCFSIYINISLEEEEGGWDAKINERQSEDINPFSFGCFSTFFSPLCISSSLLPE